MKILSVAKAALYGIFLNYYCYYVINGAFIPRGTVLFLALACLCVGVDALQQRHVYVGTEIKCWILYAVLSLITTAFIAADSGSMSFLSDIIKYVQRLAIIMMIAYICERENSIRFGLQLMAVTAVALAISVITVTGDIQLKLNITSGASLSANDTGAIMAFGCFAIVFAWGRRGHPSLLLSSLKTAGIICCLAVIFLTGSRKSIGAVAIMLALLFLLCFSDYGQKINARKLLTVSIVGIAAYLFIREYLMPYAEQTNLYTRLFGRGVEAAAESDDVRVNLYIWAMKEFIAHPLFGMGFNQYHLEYGNYTHSTYAEPLACSGLIGLLYLYPYYSMVKKQIYLIRRNNSGSYARLKQKEIFVYLCMALFVAVGIPYMYKDAPCILLGTIIASQSISFQELRPIGSTSANH